MFIWYGSCVWRWKITNRLNHYRPIYRTGDFARIVFDMDYGYVWSFDTIRNVLTGMIGETSDADFVKYVQPWVQPISDMVSPSTSFAAVPFREIERFQLDHYSYYANLFQINRMATTENYDNADEKVWKPDKNELEASATFAGYKDWVQYFNKHGKAFKLLVKFTVGKFAVARSITGAVK